MKKIFGAEIDFSEDGVDFAVNENSTPNGTFRMMYELLRRIEAQSGMSSENDLDRRIQSVLDEEENAVEEIFSWGRYEKKGKNGAAAVWSDKGKFICELTGDNELDYHELVMLFSALYHFAGGIDVAYTRDDICMMIERIIKDN